MKALFYNLVLIFLFSTSATLKSQIDFGSLRDEQLYIKGNRYNNWTVGAGFGPTFYYVDIIDYTLFPKSHYRFAPMISLARQFNRPWGVEARVMYAGMYGQKNGRYFSGDLVDATLSLTLSINQLAIFGPIADRWNIYARLGLGAVFFRSRVRDVDDDSFKKVKDVYPYISGYPNPYGWDQEDYLAIGYDRKNDPTKKTARKSEIVVPVGVGVQYRINEQFDAGFEISMHSMTKDNLDVNLSGADNDSYLFPHFSIRYKIGKKERRHPVWTYKDFNLSQRRKRETDPLAQKLDSLKQRLDQLAHNDSATSDTAHIYTQTILSENDIQVSVFFDFDKSLITERTQRELAKVALHLQQNPNARILIRGYCDARGSDLYNTSLSERRCKAIADALVTDFELSPDRFEIDPKGESELLSDTDHLKPRGLHLINRRVDLTLIKD